KITVIPKPAATITPQGSLDICTTGFVVLMANSGSGLTYQWKKGGNLLVGATNQSYSANRVNSYTVTVTNSSGCSKISAPVNVVSSCKEDMATGSSIGNALLVYPDPTSDKFNIDLAWGNENETVKIELVNLVGRVIYSETAEITDARLREEIYFSPTDPEGVYLIRVEGSNQLVTGEIVYMK